MDSFPALDSPTKFLQLTENSPQCRTHWVACQFTFYTRLLAQFAVDPSLSKYSVLDLTIFGVKAMNTAWTLIHTENPREKHAWLRDICQVEEERIKRQAEAKASALLDVKAKENPQPNVKGKGKARARGKRGGKKKGKAAATNANVDPPSSSSPSSSSSSLPLSHLPPLQQIKDEHGIDLVDLLLAHLTYLRTMFTMPVFSPLSFFASASATPVDEIVEMQKYVRTPVMTAARRELRQFLKTVFPTDEMPTGDSDVSCGIMRNIAASAELTESITHEMGGELADFQVPIKESIGMVLAAIETVYFVTADRPEHGMMMGKDGFLRPIHQVTALNFLRAAVPNHEQWASREVVCGVLRSLAIDPSQFSCAEKEIDQVCSEQQKIVAKS